MHLQSSVSMSGLQCAVSEDLVVMLYCLGVDLSRLAACVVIIFVQEFAWL